jgi:hypothetical protein
MFRRKELVCGDATDQSVKALQCVRLNSFVSITTAMMHTCILEERARREQCKGPLKVLHRKPMSLPSTTATTTHTSRTHTRVLKKEVGSGDAIHIGVAPPNPSPFLSTTTPPLPIPQYTQRQPEGHIHKKYSGSEDRF